MATRKNQKLSVALFFGGRSAEHEVSVISAQNVFSAIDKNKYKITLVGIKKDGLWVSVAEKDFSAQNFSLTKISNYVSPFFENKKFFIQGAKTKSQIDLAFPVLHGPFGEDGTIQGLLSFFDVPFVGAGVLGSAAGMDKDVMKRLLKEAGIEVPKFVVYREPDRKTIDFKNLKKSLKLPLFVKPANLGSSVGITKVEKEKDFNSAIEEAFKYDRKIIIEEGVQGREIECAVLGNDFPKASKLGEIVPKHSFYSYKAKYLDKSGADLVIPAKVSPSIEKKIQSIAVKTFQVLCCRGLGRVDFFLTKDNTILVNEINTLPGFTSISMYPKLWQESGLSYSKLIDKLIKLALEK